MLNQHYKSVPVVLGALMTMLFTGCKDDNLDLDNIDTTMKIEVTDLVLPVNLAPITFGDMVDLDSEECIEVIDDKYVLVKKGDFESKAIKIAAIDTGEDNPDGSDFEVSEPLEIPLLENHQTIDINDMEVEFDYTYNNVDEYIDDIYSGNVDIKITFTISVDYADGSKDPVNCDFTNMVFKLPEGFYGTYDGDPENIVDEDILILLERLTQSLPRVNMNWFTM